MEFAFAISMTFLGIGAVALIVTGFVHIVYGLKDFIRGFRK